MGHLGSRVTALLDGRLPAFEEDRAWEHVHSCHPCRDAVEREGWVKTQLVQLGQLPPVPSHSLRESLLNPSFAVSGATYPDELPSSPAPGQALRSRHLVALGGSALGMAVLGVVALGVGPANAPGLDRRGPLTSIVPSSASPSPRPATTPPVTTSVRRDAVREKIAP